MVRGTHKQIIHVKNPGTPWCEEAFLIVRGDRSYPGSGSTMAEEVEKMLSGTASGEVSPAAPPRSGIKRAGVALLTFFGGVCLGVAVTLLIL